MTPGGRCRTESRPQLSLNDDPRLSRYVVVERGPDGTRRLRHTVTWSTLPPDAPEEALRAEFFLAGQEEEALERRLASEPTRIALTLVVTWRCNLRCTHCSVLHRLVRREERGLRPGDFRDFVERWRHRVAPPEGFTLSLVGGEPLLEPDLCSEAVSAVRGGGTARCDITTNLAVILQPAHIELLSRLDAIVVSLDGLEEAHNAQRRPYRDGFDPFRRTWENLERLVAEGLADRIHVQGAVRDPYGTIEHFENYQRALMAIGIRWDRISFGAVHPTVRDPAVQRTFLRTLRDPLPRWQMCCKYRGGRSLTVGPDGGVYSDFYDYERLGSVGDPPEAILERFRALARSMPALRDPTCRACPVLGCCWGGCTNARLLVGDRPSEHCGRESLIRTVRRLAEEGRLPEHGARPRCG